MSDQNKSGIRRKQENQPALSVTLGMVIGAGFGTVIGIIFDVLPFGISIGSGCGLMFGALVANFVTTESNEEAE